VIGAAGSGRCRATVVQKVGFLAGPPPPIQSNPIVLSIFYAEISVGRSARQPCTAAPKLALVSTEGTHGAAVVPLYPDDYHLLVTPVVFTAVNVRAQVHRVPGTGISLRVCARRGQKEFANSVHHSLPPQLHAPPLR
jgi:hypothetical protein